MHTVEYADTIMIHRVRFIDAESFDRPLLLSMRDAPASQDQREEEERENESRESRRVREYSIRANCSSASLRKSEQPFRNWDDCSSESESATLNQPRRRKMRREGCIRPLRGKRQVKLTSRRNPPERAGSLRLGDISARTKGRGRYENSR